jgi:hypothetical protein
MSGHLQEEVSYQPWTKETCISHPWLRRCWTRCRHPHECQRHNQGQWWRNFRDLLLILARHRCFLHLHLRHGPRLLVHIPLPHHVQLWRVRPWLLWWRRGSKRFCVGDRRVDLVWDLSRERFLPLYPARSSHCRASMSCLQATSSPWS